MAISSLDFDFVRNLVLQRSAITLDDNKAYLAENRLSVLAASEGLDSLNELIRRIRIPDQGLQQKVVEAMTTNETYFFRDNHPFEMLQKVLFPQIIERNKTQQEINIWSAACSTGQEAVSIALTFREFFPQCAGWRFKIFGTDLTTTVLTKAKSGKYSPLEVNRGLPIRYLPKYFTKDGNDWLLKPEIRSMCEFRQMNLIGYWPALPQFDIILIRNVLIYFDTSTKKEILGKCRKHLRPGGALLLGGSETTLGIDENWERVNAPPSYYYKSKV